MGPVDYEIMLFDYDEEILKQLTTEEEENG
jgi:hypothetical protein